MFNPNPIPLLRAIRDRLLAGPTGAQDDPRHVQLSGKKALDGGEVTLVLSGETATGFADIPDEASGFVGALEGGAIRAWWGGATPTTESGVYGEGGDPVTIATRDDLLRFKAIAVAGEPTIVGHYT